MLSKSEISVNFWRKTQFFETLGCIFCVFFYKTTIHIIGVIVLLYELPVYTKNKITLSKSVMSNARKKGKFLSIFEEKRSFYRVRIHVLCFFLQNYHIYLMCCTLLKLLNYLNYMFTPKNKMTPCKTVVSNVQNK